MAVSSWREMGDIAKKAAKAKGHTVTSFPPKQRTPNVRMGTCETCFGCCWIACDYGGRFSAGGRLLKYECGTPEAMGLLPTEARDAQF